MAKEVHYYEIRYHRTDRYGISQNGINREQRDFFLPAPVLPNLGLNGVMGEAASPEPRPPSEELESLMSRYQQAEAPAAAALIERVSPQVFSFFLAQVRDRSRAEDLLQDFWLRVHNARRTYRPAEPVLPWIFAIARRVQIDDYRRRSRISRHEFQSEQLPQAPANRSGAASFYEVEDLLKSLPEGQREAVLLLKVVGLSLEETARATGTTVGAVKQKAHRAYETLRKLFGGES